MAEKLLKGTKTHENLMKAFIGESVAKNKYEMFSSIAFKEGYKELSKIFYETSTNEKEHSEVYLKLLKEENIEVNNLILSACLSNTKENLLCSINSEDDEATCIYPSFGLVAEEEGFFDISHKFYEIAEIEQYHCLRYRKLLEKLDKDMFYKSDSIVRWQCSHCGHIVEGKFPPEKCPVCEHLKMDFFRKCECI